MPDALKIRLLGWRNRVLADPHFQRFATRFPPLRPIARTRASSLFDLVAGFTYSQILAAALESGLLDVLADGPVRRSALGTLIGLPPDGADRLARAAAALDLVQRVGERWMLGSAGAALRGNPGIADMIAHHRALYADLSDPIALLRRGGGGGALSRYWSYAERSGEGRADEVDGYSRLMAASQPLVAEQILRAYDFGRHASMLDVAGGEGAFAAAVRAQHPALPITILDLPAVIERADARLAEKGVPRVATCAGDMLRDPLPRGHDLMTLVRVLHDHDDAPALKLLRAIRAALVPGGRLLIAEPMSDAPGAKRMGDGYFGMYLLAMGSGRPRTAAEIRAMLVEAGFSRSHLKRTAMPLTVGAIVATP